MQKTWRIVMSPFLLIFLFAPISKAAEINKTIILTFDDGPNPAVLEKLLPLLAQHNAKASFFVVGSAVGGNERWILRESQERHTVENHSWGHENMKHTFAKSGIDAIIRSIELTSYLIEDTTSRRPKYFRPPFWEITKEIEEIIRDSGYQVMKIGSPDINSLDYEDAQKKRPASALVARVKNLVAARERKGLFRHVLVFHELPLTVTALREFFPYFAAQGYEFLSLGK